MTWVYRGSYWFLRGATRIRKDLSMAHYCQGKDGINCLFVKNLTLGRIYQWQTEGRHLHFYF